MVKHRIAVVGATGAVGQKIIELLEKSHLPIDSLVPLASKNSIGKKISFRGEKIAVKLAEPKAFEHIDYALFSAGASVSKELAPEAVKRGAIVVDNSSAFRMDEEVPLVVPEVNPDDIKNHKGIISNPNCSTIQMVVALKPLYDYGKITKIIVSTYQAVSGTGYKGILELQNQTRELMEGKDSNNLDKKVYPYPIAFNLLPHIDVFLDNNYTKEEMKMVNETRKIMGDKDISVSPTAVRVPVLNCHSESITIETEKKITREKAIELLSNSPGITLMDDPKNLKYPTPWHVSGNSNVFVGRIREDFSFENGLNLWVVGDNILKGAAYNAVQILEKIING